MNIVSFSDGHLLWDKPRGRKDNIVEAQFQKLDFIFDYAERTKSILIVAGDLSNRPRNWYLLPELIYLRRKYPDVAFFGVWGQHDEYMRSKATRKATNMGVLEAAGLIQILGPEPLSVSNEEPVALYGCSWGEEIPKPLDEVYFNVLVIHAPIAEKALWSGQNYLDAMSFLKDHPFDLIVCGDIHQKFAKTYKGRWIVNSGPLLRKEATAYNFTHAPGFWFYDSGEGSPEWVEVPHRPAEEVLSRDHIEYEKEETHILEDFISLINQPEIEDGADIKKNIWIFCKANPEAIDQPVIDLLSEVMEHGSGDC